MKKIIGFVTLGIEFNGDSIKEKSLGGSESAMIYMARELARLGNEVIVFCPCDKPGVYGGVQYHDIEVFNNRAFIYSFDVMVISRFIDFATQPLDSKMNILWLHDMPQPEDLSKKMWQIDKIFNMSQYQKQIYIDKYPSFRGYIDVTKNGYDSELAKFILANKEQPSIDTRLKNFTYISRPERGLGYLLTELWPEILKKIPDATLNICAYDSNVKNAKMVIEPEFYDMIDALVKKTPNIKNHGNLNKIELYRLLSNCGVMLYPTAFPEISCISAIEAQGTGCVIVTTDDFALSETVKTDTLIDAEVGSNKYKDMFLSKVFDLYDDKEYWFAQSELGKEKMADYSWRAIAADWNARFDKMFMDRFHKNQKGVATKLFYNSDVVAGYEVFGEEDILPEKYTFGNFKDYIDVSVNSNLDYEQNYNPVFDAEPEKYNKRIGHLVEFLQKHLPKTRQYTVLDVACNTGMMSSAAQRNLPNIKKVIGVDAHKPSLDVYKANCKFPQNEFYLHNVTDLDSLEIEPVDMIFAGEIMEHVRDPYAFIESILRKCAENCNVIFSVPYGPWEQISYTRGYSPEKDIKHIHHFEYADIKHIFQEFDGLFVTRAGTQMTGLHNEPLDTWTFGFKYSPSSPRKIHKINYLEKAFKTRPYKSISTCMIVKNEEDNLSRCLKSVKLISDEIIIVDTGSTDSTKQIAAKFTDKIYDHRFEEEDGVGNFGAARNFAMSKATGDWIFYIDADEVAMNPQFLGYFSDTEFFDGIAIQQRQARTSNGDPDKELPVRMFKNNGNIKFYGVLHEHPGYDINSFVEGAMLMDMTWLNHYGYVDDDVTKWKIATRNRPLLMKDLRMNPDRDINKVYLLMSMIGDVYTYPAGKLGIIVDKIADVYVVWDRYFKEKRENDIGWEVVKQRGWLQYQMFLYNLYQNKEFGIIKFEFTKNDEEKHDYYFRDNDELMSFLREHMT